MKVRMLTVDDSKAVRTLIKRHLAGTGIVIDEASNGAEGLKLLLQNEYDFAIIDLMMPTMDGLTMLRMKDAKRNKTPVIVLTAEPGKELTDAMANECVMDYLKKPLDGKKLLPVIQQLLSLREPDPEEAGSEDSSAEGGQS